MYWDWMTYLAVVGAIAATLACLWVVFGGGNPFGLLWLMLAVVLVGSMFLRTWAHNRDQHDAQAKAQLQRQGFEVIEALTTDHQATIAIGACERTLVMKHVKNVWHLYVNQPDGQTVFYSVATAKKTGTACNPTIR